jgi:glutathione synthase/RimK-type ligase-like ATP-grasp enzyme
MKQIILISDYLDRFGTKFTGIPYRSGMSIQLLKEEFASLGYEIIFIKASDILQKVSDPKGRIFLYTSSEDKDEHYKSFLEDIVLALQSMGGIIIPEFLYLRAHNNKVLMEMLRKEWGPSVGDSLRSYTFGSLEELESIDLDLRFPVVIKRPEGFKSRGVFLASDMKELRRIAGRISRTVFLKGEVKDIIRTFIYKGFKKESCHRKKYLVQSFISGLENDFKVLVFGKKYYVLMRQTRKNDFRASGSGLLSYPKDLPPGLLDFCEKVFLHFNVPFVSLDIAFDNTTFYVMEAQFLYFGTYTLEHSDYYFTREQEKWKMENGRSVLEKEFAQSIARFIANQKIGE